VGIRSALIFNQRKCHVQILRELWAGIAIVIPSNRDVAIAREVDVFPFCINQDTLCVIRTRTGMLIFNRRYAVL